MNTTEVTNDVVKTESFITKYWKILMAVLIIVFLFSIYGNISSCVKGKKVVPVDTLQAYLQKEKKIELDLLSQIALLKTTHKQDSVKYAKLEADRSNIQIIYIKSQDSARKLPLPAAVKLMAQNLKDTVKNDITVEVIKKDTAVKIQPKHVYDINATYITNNFLQKDNDLLKRELLVANSKDSISCVIIKKYETLLGDKDNIQKALETDNTNLTKNLDKMTKAKNRQKFFKDVFEGIAGVAIIYDILK